MPGKQYGKYDRDPAPELTGPQTWRRPIFYRDCNSWCRRLCAARVAPEGDNIAEVAARRRYRRSESVAHAEVPVA